MARHRMIAVKIWSDPNFQNYTPNQKLVFIYLFGNPATTESGIYPITPKTIAHDTGLPVKSIEKILRDTKNIKYDWDNHCVFVVNFLSYNKLGNPKLIKKSIAKDIQTTRTTLWNDFKERYSLYFEEILSIVNSLDNILSKDLQVNNEHEYENDNSNKDKEGKSQKSLIKEFWVYYLANLKKAGWIKRDLQLTHARKRLIESRLNEHKTIGDLKLCADNFIKDTWEERNKFIDLKYCIGVIRGIDMCEKWLNFKSVPLVDYERLLKTCLTDLEKSSNEEKIKSWLYKFPPKYHIRIFYGLNKIYPGGHSYSKAKDQYEKEKK